MIDRHDCWHVEVKNIMNEIFSLGGYSALCTHDLLLVLCISGCVAGGRKLIVR